MDAKLKTLLKGVPTNGKWRKDKDDPNDVVYVVGRKQYLYAMWMAGHRMKFLRLDLGDDRPRVEVRIPREVPDGTLWIDAARIITGLN